MTKYKTNQYTVAGRNEPGMLFRIIQTLAKQNINITGITSYNAGDISVVSFVADKETVTVRRPLENAGYKVFEQPVFQLALPNQPGELSRLCRALADEDINIIGLYGATEGAEPAKLVLSVDQPEKAQSILNRVLEKTHALE